MESGERDAFSRVCLKEDSRKLYGLLSEILTERERTVLVMRYGLYHGREYTQREIAAKLGISRVLHQPDREKRPVEAAGIFSAGIT